MVGKPRKNPLGLVQFRRLPSDSYFLRSIGDHYGIDNSAVFRMVLRDFAYKHGFASPEFHDVLEILRDLVAGCRAAGVQGMDKTLEKAEKVWERHYARVEKVYKRRPPDLKDLTHEIALEEKLIRKRHQRNTL